MAFLSTSDLNALRTFQEDLMESTCLVERPDHATKTLDTGTGLVAAPGTTEVYNGACRISTVSSAGKRASGDEVVAFVSTKVHIPYTASQVEVDDIVTILTCADATLVNRVFTVVSVDQTQYLTARSFAVEAPAQGRTF